MALVLAAVTQYGHTEHLFNRFLYGSDVDPHSTFKNKPHAQECERTARSTSVLHGILPRANHVWRLTNTTTSYGGTYKAMDPQSHFNQDFDLVMLTAVSSHLLRTYNKIGNLKSTPCNENKNCRCDHDNSDYVCGASGSVEPPQALSFVICLRRSTPNGTASS